MGIYVPKHFIAEEFVPPDYFAAHGADSLKIMDDGILETMDLIWEYFNPAPLVKKVAVTINNWKWVRANPFTQRGFRPKPLDGKYPNEPHLFGLACDFDVGGTSAAQFRGMVRAGRLDSALALVNRIEDNVNWNHIDRRALAPGQTRIHFFT